jgi:probable phosphoglycerate mutase
MAAYSSDSKRALDTAKKVIGDREIPIIQDARFREMHFGDLEALEEAKLPSPHQHFFADLYSMKNLEFSSPGGESLSQVFRRTDAAVKDIIDTYPNKSGNILVFTHGVTLGNYMMHLKGDREYPVHGNCSVSIVKFRGDDYDIEKIADRSFLENC